MNTSVKTAGRRALTACAVALFTILGFAARTALAQSASPPGMISFQGFLTDANNIALATNAPKNYDVTFTIYDGPSASANPLWSELQTVTVDRGYFSVMLGQGSPISGFFWTNNLAVIFGSTNASDRYVGITAHGLANPDAEIQPRLRLVAAPYSFLSATAIVASNAVALSGMNGTQIITTLGTNVGVNRPASSTNSLEVGGNLLVAGNTYLNGLLRLTTGNTIELGVGTAKEPNAGKIGYQLLDSALDIVGAGTTTNNRQIKLYAEGGVSSTGPLTVTGSITGGAINGTSASLTGSVSASSLSASTATVSSSLLVGSGADAHGGALGLGGAAFLNNKNLYLDNGTENSFLTHDNVNDGATLVGNRRLTLGVNLPSSSGVYLDANGFHATDINLGGRIISSKLGAQSIWQNVNGPLTLQSTFTSGGGTLVVSLGGSGWINTANKTISMSLLIDGAYKATTSMYVNNQISQHMAFPAVTVPVGGIAAGNHSISLVAGPGTITDQNDCFTVTVVELPY